jgi:hypothetical protein
MEWSLVVLNNNGQVIFGPEIYPAGYLAYRRSYEITEGKIDIKEHISPRAAKTDKLFSVQIYLVLESSEQVLFMEKRGFMVKNKKYIDVKWVERPDTERPFRVTIRPDYCAYAWDEYGVAWFIDYAFPDNFTAKELDKNFSEWLRIFENIDIDNHGRPIINFSWQEFHETGLSLAKRLKKLGKENIVIFYEKPYEDTFIFEDIRVISAEEVAA